MGMVLACYSNPSNYNKTMSIKGAAVFVGDTCRCWNLTSLCSLSWPWGFRAGQKLEAVFGLLSSKAML